MAAAPDCCWIGDGACPIHGQAPLDVHRLWTHELAALLRRDDVDPGLRERAQAELDERAAALGP